jgi:hypothetical protein
MVHKAIEDINNTATAPVPAPPEKEGAAANATQAKTAAPAVMESSSKMSPKMSKGERVFNWTVYSGINYWVNLLSSIVIADYFINKGGKDILNKGAESLGKAVASSRISSYERGFKNSQTALKTLTLLSGGWLLLVPMKLMEDNKRPIVHWLNKKLGVDQTAPDGHQETPDEIYIEQEQPQQSWVNVIKRRVIATAAVVGTGHVVNAAFRDRAKTNAYHGEDDPHGGKAVVENFVVNNLNKVFKSGYFPGGNFLATNATAQRYLGLAALDTVFTKITAVIMKATNGAKKAKMPKEIGDEKSPPGVEVLDAIALQPEQKEPPQAQAAPPVAPVAAAEMNAPGKEEPCECTTAEKYRKKPIEKVLPLEKSGTFADRVANEQTSYSLAP